MQLASTIMMIRPANFGYNAETARDNVFQSAQNDDVQRVSAQALTEFDAMVDKLRQQGVNVWVVEDTPLPVKPDAVFSNNWLCTLPAGSLFVFPVKAENRRLEVRYDIIDQLRKKFEVTHFKDISGKAAEGIFLESTGSIIFDHKAKEAYAVISQRTNVALFEAFCEEVTYTPHTFRASTQNNEDIYHTNVMMHIGDTYAIICLEAINTVKEQIKISNALRNSGHEIIAISYEQMHAFAGNMLQVKNTHGKKLTVLSAAAHASLTPEQRSLFNKHTDLLPVEVSAIEAAGGGSVRCMMTEIFLKESV